MDRYTFSFWPTPTRRVDGTISVAGYSGPSEALQLADFSLLQGGRDLHELLLPSSCTLQVAQVQLYQLLPLLQENPLGVRLLLTSTEDGTTAPLWAGMLAMEAFEQDVSYQVALVELPFSCGMNRLKSKDYAPQNAFLSPIAVLRSCVLQLGDERQLGFAMQDVDVQDASFSPSLLLERDVLHDSVFAGSTCWEVCQQIAQLYGLRMARHGEHFLLWPAFSTAHLLGARYWRMDALYPSDTQLQRYKRVGVPAQEAPGELLLQGRQRAVVEAGCKELRILQPLKGYIPAVQDAYQNVTEFWDGGAPSGIGEATATPAPDGAFFRIRPHVAGQPSQLPPDLVSIDTAQKLVRYAGGPQWILQGNPYPYFIAGQRQYTHFAYTPKLEVKFRFRIRKKAGAGIVLLRKAAFRAYVRMVDVEAGTWVWLNCEKNSAWPTYPYTGKQITYDREQEVSYQQQATLEFDFAAPSSDGTNDGNGFDYNGPRMVQLQLYLESPFALDGQDQAAFEQFDWEFYDFTATLTPAQALAEQQDETIYTHSEWGTRKLEAEVVLREEQERLGTLGAILRRQDAAPFAPITTMRELTPPGLLKAYVGDYQGQPSFSPLGTGRADTMAARLFAYAARPLHTIALELRGGTELRLSDVVRFDQDGSYGDYWVGEMDQGLRSSRVTLIRQDQRTNTWA